MGIPAALLYLYVEGLSCIENFKAAASARFLPRPALIKTVTNGRHFYLTGASVGGFL